MKGKACVIKKMKQVAACILALTMCLGTPLTALAEVKEADAKTIKLSKIVGIVNVNKGAKAVPKVTEGMRMHDGHTVVTDKESNAFFELDASKYIKMDQISKVKVQKSKNTNKIMVESGTVFFNVTKPLADEETMEIKTPTIVMGVRGTSGVVGFREAGDSERQLFIATVQIYTGLGMVSVADDVSGETTVYPVEPGTQIEISTNASTGAQTVAAGKLDQSGLNIPVVAAEELLQNPKLLEVIEATTQIKITEETVQQKKTEEKAIVESKIETVNKAMEAVKEQNKSYESVDTSKDKTDSRPSQPTAPAPTEPAPTEPAPTEPAPTEPAPTEPAPTAPAPTEPAPTEPAPTEPEPSDPTNVFTGNILDTELLNAFQKFDQVIIKNGKISLTKNIAIPLGKSLVLEENGSLDLNGMDLELYGELINNSPNSIRLGNNTLFLEGGGRLLNSGAITAENGKIQVNGAQAYIKNTAGQTIPHIAIGTTGDLLIENESGVPQPGKINRLSGDGAAKVRFKDTQNSSASNYGGAGSFKDIFSTLQEHVTFGETYNWDGSAWKLNMPENLIYAKDYKNNLAARLEAAFQSGATAFTVVCGGTGMPDVLEKDLTIPEGKTLIVSGESGSLALDKTAIGIINNGTIQIGTAEKSGTLAEAGEEPGNIINNGVVAVLNGILTINDNGNDFSTALGGSVAVSNQGTLKVYSGPDEGPYWGHISGMVMFANGSTIDLNSSNPEALTYLNLLEGATAIDRGYVISKNNEGSEFVDSRVFEGYGTSAAPYLIKTDRDLYKLQLLMVSTKQGDAKYRKAHYRLVQDIELDDTAEWAPLGTEEQPFEGAFDGNERTISNVHMASEQSSNVGFFGVIKGAVIENLFLEKVDIQGGTNVGGIVGNADMDSAGSHGSVISNCKVAGEIGGEGKHVGGIAGLLKSSTIKQCVNTAEIQANDYTGGIAGKILNGTVISECFNRGTIAAASYTGGLVGGSTGGSIADSYNEGSVSGRINTGGIVGFLEPHVSSTSSGVRHTFSRGSVSGDSPVGGIVGKAVNNASIGGTRKITIVKNTFLGNVSSGHRIVDECDGAKNSSAFDIRENYGSGNSQSGDVKYDGISVASFNKSFWLGTVLLDVNFWEVEDGGDASAEVIPILKNIQEEQNTVFMFRRMGAVAGLAVTAAANPDAIATAIENGFEEEDLITLLFEENETVDLEKDLTIPEGKTLRIIGTSLTDRKKSAGLNIPNGITLTNHGTIEIGTEYEEGVPAEAGVLSQGTLGKNTIINHGIIDVKQGVLRISAEEEILSGIGGEIIVGQDLEADSVSEAPQASLMVCSGNRSKKIYWGKIAGELTVYGNGRIDLFHEDRQVTVNLLLLEGSSITAMGEAYVYKNLLSNSKVVFEEDLLEETLPEEVEPSEKTEQTLPEEGKEDDLTVAEPPVAKDEEDDTEEDDTVEDDTVEDDTVEDGAVEDDTVEDDIVEDGAVEDDTVEDDTVEDGAVEDDTVEDDTVEDGAVEDDTVDNDIVEGAATEDDTVEDDTATNDTLPKTEMSEGPRLQLLSTKHNR